MKLKLTAVDGSRVRKVGVAWFGSNRAEDYSESDLMVLTNQGDVHVVSLPSVKLQVHYPCIRKEDVSGITSCIFTKHGQGNTQHSQLCTSLDKWHILTEFYVVLGFYLISPSEFERFSLSTRCVVEPRCLLAAPLHPRTKPDGASSANR